MTRTPEHPAHDDQALRHGTDVQPSLLDAMADEPVPFVLTARARRAIAPESLPPLALLAGGHEPASTDEEVGDALADAAEGLGDVDAPIAFVPADHPATGSTHPDGVEESVDEEDLADPRRARARALRRAGTSADAIATELGVEHARVERWTADVAPAVPAVRRQRAAERRHATDLPSAYVSGRAAARAAWQRGTAVSSGAAMVAGMAEVTPFAVRLRGELGVVAGILQWLRDAVVVAPGAVSAQVAAAPGSPLDRVAHDVAARLQLDLARVAAHPWADAPDRDACEVSVRIADPHLAGTVAGWREGLLASLVGDPVAAVAG